MISATCHCGAIRVDIPSAPDTATSCNCSICRRLGALWAFYPADAVRITAEPAVLDGYVWGEGKRRFVRCRVCGCTTHVDLVARGPDSKIEVNLRLFEPAALGHFRIRWFDGADTWAYVHE